MINHLFFPLHYFVDASDPLLKVCTNILPGEERADGGERNTGERRRRLRTSRYVLNNNERFGVTPDGRMKFGQSQTIMYYR
jgi:hypothetical protein